MFINQELLYATLPKCQQVLEEFNLPYHKQTHTHSNKENKISDMLQFTSEV